MINSDIIEQMSIFCVLKNAEPSTCDICELRLYLPFYELQSEAYKTPISQLPDKFPKSPR